MMPRSHEQGAEIMSGIQMVDKQAEEVQNDNKYPPGMIAEYQRLALKELETPLTPEEKSRLQELIAQIEAIGCADPRNQHMQAHCEELEARLEQIRRKAETLLDADR